MIFARSKNAPTLLAADLVLLPLAAAPASSGTVPHEIVVTARLPPEPAGRVYGDPVDSSYTMIPGSSLGNASLGWRAEHVEFYVWSRNLTNRDCMQNRTINAGHSGLILGTPGDPRTAGLTVRTQ
jgi:hypothetical protein